MPKHLRSLAEITLHGIHFCLRQTDVVTSHRSLIRVASPQLCPATATLASQGNSLTVMGAPLVMRSLTENAVVEGVRAWPQTGKCLQNLGTY